MTARPASERLVAAALACLGERRARVVDVGTGSGAIALALAAAVPAADVWATDTSEAAVALARANANRHGLGERVTIRRGDLLDPVPGRVDLVVANLPYLPAAAAPSRPELGGEPPEALFASGDGLGPYRRLLSACAQRLRSEGRVILQLHRQVFQGRGDELDALRAEVEAVASARAPLRAAA